MTTTHDNLARLETMGLLQVAQQLPELEYLFRHALVQDAAYESLLRADRRRLHARVGATLESLYPDRLPELAPVLAGHFRGAGEIDQARAYFTLAGDQALAAYANHEAEQHYRAALALTADDDAQAPLLAGLGEALARQNRPAAALATWREAIRRYTLRGDRDTSARLYARAARAISWSGDTPGSLALCYEGLAAIPEAPATPGRTALLHETARLLYYSGRATDAWQMAGQALALAEQAGDLEIQAEALITRAWHIYQPPAERIAMMERAAALAEGAGLLIPAARALNNLSLILSDKRMAREHLWRAAALAHQVGVADLEFQSRANADYYSLQLGDFAAVESDLHALRALLDPSHKKRVHQVLLVESGLLHRRGAWAEAERGFRAAQALSHEIGNLQVVGFTEMLLVDLLIEQGAWAEAGAIAARLIPLAGQVGNDYTEAYRLLIIIRAHEGRLADARRLLAEIRGLAAADPRLDETLADAEAALAVAEARWPDAWAAFARAAAAQAHRENHWQQAGTLYTWAAAHLTCGAAEDRAAARDLLHEARALYMALEVPRYVARVDARLAQMRSTATAAAGTEPEAGC